MNRPASARDMEGALTLGQAVGVYRERPVQPGLREHFACVWFHAVPQDAAGQSVIIPDGCADLLWFNGRLSVAGPDRQAKIEAVPPGSTVIGLRFRPGAAARWLRIPLSDIVDARLPLEGLWGHVAQDLADWIGEASSSEHVAERLEIALMRRLPSIAPPDEAAAAIFAVVSRRADFSVPVTRELNDELGLSERTLRRRCIEAFGYGPKTLDRILRFQQFLLLAGHDGSIGLADLAAGAGYADQPHLTREARDLGKLTPSTIRAQLIR